MSNGRQLRRREMGDFIARDHMQRASAPALMSDAAALEQHEVLRYGGVLLVRRRNALPMQRLSGRRAISDLPADRSPRMVVRHALSRLSPPIAPSR